MSMIDTKLMIEDSSDIIEFNPVYGELIDEELLERRDEATGGFFGDRYASCKRLERSFICLHR